MIHPENKYKFLWDYFMVCINTYVILAVPFNIVVGFKLTNINLLLETIVTVILSVDLFINFYTGINKNREYIFNKKIIAKSYLKNNFFLDLVSTIPFHLLLYLLFSGSSLLNILKFISLIRILRITHLISFSKRLKDPRIFNHPFLRFALFLFWILLFSHWVTCGWLLLGDRFDSAEKWPHYLKSLYWTITTLTTVGYGDIIPQTTFQIIYTIIIMMLGAGVYGYTIGNMAGLIANINVAKIKYLKSMDSLNAFFRFKKIPSHLQKKVLDYQDYLWQSRLGYDEHVVLEKLPSSLKTEISMFLNRGIIQKVPFFQNTSENFIREIACELRPVVFTPGDYVMRKGEVGDVMYFISNGSVDIVSDDGIQRFKKLYEGDFFGEMALILSTARTATIRSCGYCDLYMLSKKSLDRAIKHHPKFKKQLNDAARGRLQGFQKIRMS